MNETLERKCQLEDVFEGSFIELLRLAPANPLVRAMVLKLSGKMPPMECQTFEQIKDWVEANCLRRRRAVYTKAESTPGISIGVTFSELEYGRCNYKAPRSSLESYELGADELVDIIREVIEAGGGLDEVVESIARLINDNGWNECSPDLDDYGDYEHYDYESSDSEGGETDFNRTEIQRAVLGFVQRLHPELADQLNQ